MTGPQVLLHHMLMSLVGGLYIFISPDFFFSLVIFYIYFILLFILLLFFLLRFSLCLSHFLFPFYFSFFRLMSVHTDTPSFLVFLVTRHHLPQSQVQSITSIFDYWVNISILIQSWFYFW